MFRSIWAKFGLEDKICGKQKIMPETQNRPQLARNAPFAYLGAPRGCQSVVLYVHMAKSGTPGACLGGKRPENGRNVGQKTKIDPSRNLCPKLETHPGWPEISLLLI
jgi:hypothetical protein